MADFKIENKSEYMKHNKTVIFDTNNMIFVTDKDSNTWICFDLIRNKSYMCSNDSIVIKTIEDEELRLLIYAGNNFTDRKLLETCLEMIVNVFDKIYKS